MDFQKLDIANAIKYEIEWKESILDKLRNNSIISLDIGGHKIFLMKEGPTKLGYSLKTLIIKEIEKHLANDKEQFEKL